MGKTGERRGRLGKWFFLTLPLASPVFPVFPQASPRLGTISFPTSGGREAQAAFVEGVLLLHSFEYARAQKSFQRARELEPRFVMAYWGEAMTYTHPVWNEQDRGAALAALQRLGPSAAERRRLAPTARERQYLETVEVLYGEGSKPRRDTLYARAVEQLVRDFPDDPEAKAFYALALIGLNQGVRDTTTYLRAVPYADTVFRANPDHPGAAHYLIHALDDPFHARRGLPAARAYIGIAPGAAHAQHMTTHIFLALGMWDEVVSQNTIAMKLQAELPGHYTSWLVYGLLQQGRFREARELMAKLSHNLGSGGTHAQHAALGSMWGHFVLNSGMVDSIPPPAGHELSVAAQMGNWYVRGALGFHAHDQAALAAAETHLRRVIGLVRTEYGADDPTAQAGDVMRRQLGAMRLALNGTTAEAIAELRAAAALEDAIPMEFGPPVIMEPSHWLLGSLLLDSNGAEALAEFERADQRAPGRSLTLVSLIGAAIGLQDKVRATAALDRLERNWARADAGLREGLAKLRAEVAALP